VFDEVIKTLFKPNQSDGEKAKVAFEFVRDRVHHSWDIQHTHVTCIASDVLQWKEGICYAKSHLLAALLRSQGIPAGFCYQRLILFDTPEEGYCIHALNAAYLKKFNRWFRLDARGNKKGVNAQFSTDQEMLAFPIRESLGERDYPVIYAQPHPKVVETLLKNNDALDMILHHLPTEL
jgi:transglutaminase-like putative cysteine protease